MTVKDTAAHVELLNMLLHYHDDANRAENNRLDVEDAAREHGLSPKIMELARRELLNPGYIDRKLKQFAKAKELVTAFNAHSNKSSEQ